MHEILLVAEEAEDGSQRASGVEQVIQTDPTALRNFTTRPVMRCTAILKMGRLHR
jgi:hypothetical protein